MEGEGEEGWSCVSCTIGELNPKVVLDMKTTSGLKNSKA